VTSNQEVGQNRGQSVSIWTRRLARDGLWQRGEQTLGRRRQRQTGNFPSGHVQGAAEQRVEAAEVKTVRGAACSDRQPRWNARGTLGVVWPNSLGIQQPPCEVTNGRRAGPVYGAKLSAQFSLMLATAPEA
jgi:hypothetical protein